MSSDLHVKVKITLFRVAKTWNSHSILICVVNIGLAKKSVIFFPYDGSSKHLVVFNIIPKFFFFNFIYLFLESGEGREKERERNINVWLPPVYPLLGTCNPGMCPDWELNQ